MGYVMVISELEFRIIVTVLGRVYYTLNYGGVLKSMLASDIAIIDIEEYQIKHLKVVIKLL